MADAQTKVAKQRLPVFELAETLGNVSEACRRRGMTRNSFYEYKRRFQTHGLEGLKDLPPVAKSHPHSTPEATIERVVEVALEHPSYGCNRLEAIVKAEGHGVSSVTIQNILKERELGSRYERWLALERRRAEEPIELAGEQIAFIEKQNPCFRERHVESTRPGDLLSQDIFYVGYLKGVGKVYLHTVVDTHGSYAFGFLHPSKQPEAAVAVLHNDVLPFYEELGLSVQAVLTDNGREFCGRDEHPYELYLGLNEIEHRTTRVARPQTNGFVERFHGAALDEFRRVAFRQNFYDSVEELQRDFDDWLRHYNTERPHIGYRNQGRTPWETVQKHLESEPSDTYKVSA